jgi:myosin heavy subunit
MKTARAQQGSGGGGALSSTVVGVKDDSKKKGIGNGVAHCGRMTACGLQFIENRMGKKGEGSTDMSGEHFGDMIHMPHMTVDTIMQNLSLRYSQDIIYTNIGPSILVAVNPYKRLPIYTLDNLHSYTNHSHGQKPPHVFALADLIYRNMVQSNGDQSVVVSGESGSGKTESCRFLIQYLINITGDTSRVEKQLVRANHILESFGNACTERNNNSSRFGKFTKISFNNGRISGSRITHYLLEKSRIAHVGHLNRNFHIFYELTLGGASRVPGDLTIGPPSSYAYLSESGLYEINEWKEEERIVETCDSMRELEIETDLQIMIFRVLLAILHLGQVRDGGEGSKVKGANSYLLIF